MKLFAILATLLIQTNAFAAEPLNVGETVVARCGYARHEATIIATARGYFQVKFLNANINSVCGNEAFLEKNLARLNLVEGLTWGRMWWTTEYAIGQTVLIKPMYTKYFAQIVAISANGMVKLKISQHPSGIFSEHDGWYYISELE